MRFDLLLVDHPPQDSCRAVIGVADQPLRFAALRANRTLWVPCTTSPCEVRRAQFEVHRTTQGVFTPAIGLDLHRLCLDTQPGYAAAAAAHAVLGELEHKNATEGDMPMVVTDGSCS